MLALGRHILNHFTELPPIAEVLPSQFVPPHLPVLSADGVHLNYVL
jgi:hypothetical protein